MARKNDYILEVDKIIGGKIYSLRLAQGLPRKQLAKSIDVSYPQLEKYEKGTNRISVGRLTLIAKALSTNISYFCDDLDVDNQEPVMTQRQRMCIEVSRNFMKIKDSHHQEAVNILIKSLAK